MPTRVRDLEIGIMELPLTHVSFTHTKEYFIVHVAMCIFQFILEKSLEARSDLTDIWRHESIVCVLEINN